jgi:hypothetical protein
LGSGHGGLSQLTVVGGLQFCRWEVADLAVQPAVVLELRLSPRPEFSAHVAASDPWLVMQAWDSQRMTVVLPAGAALDPPTDRMPMARPEDAVPWADVPILITRMTTGELRLVF